ncbi:MAG: hypothetical protein CVU15_10645 [Betaproteobacteria bacterium HGW-Betaproteobacteria-1]|jgi:uncharacterized membrane protein (UPF0136 family)|nr:MAG: hypothetical protein CVU15_10645 [Betaproteobacteria bacterium HGW-Betaproteobacteria-1]
MLELMRHWLRSVIGVLPKDSFQTITWFFHDFVFRYKKILLIIVFSGFSAASMQGSILFLINSLIAETGAVHNLYNLVLKLNIFIRFEWFLFLIIIFGLTLSAAFIFLQAKLTLSLWRKYQIHLTNQMLNALHGAIDRGLNLDLLEIKKTPIAAVLKSTQRMGAFTRLVTNSILPAMRFLTFSAFAFYAQPIISALVYFVALPIGMAVLYLSAKSASGNDYEAESLALRYSKEIDQRIEFVTLGSDYRIDTTKHSTNSAITLRLDKLLSSLIGAERTRFFVSLLTIVMLGLVTIFSGILVNQESSGEFLVYLAALILAFSQLSNVLAIASLFGRFYPTVYRYRKVFHWLNTAGPTANISTMLSRASYQYRTMSDDDDFN